MTELEDVYKVLGYDIKKLERKFKTKMMKVCNIEKYDKVIFLTIESGEYKKRKYEVAIGDVGMLCNCIGWALYKKCAHLAFAIKVIYETYGVDLLKDYLKKAVKEEVINV
jgi:hypothetical protein